MKTRKIALFLLLAFLLSWAIAGIIYFLTIKMQSVTGTILLVIYMYMPALAAFVVQKLIYKEEVIKPLRISFKVNIYFLWALLVPLILVLLSTAVGFVFPGVEFTPDMSGMMEVMREKLSPEQFEQMELSYSLLPIHPIWLSLIQGTVAALTINALAGFGEELGWRGFLLSEFKNKSFVSASLIIGVIWGLWHAPIILMGHNYPQHPVWGVLFMTIFCLLFTFLFNYITIKSKSVVAASVMHGSLNAFIGISLMLSSRSSDLIVGMTGFSGICVLIIAVGLLFMYDKWVSREGLMSGTIGEGYS